MPFGLGIWEIVILLGVLALLFGAKGVPEVARRLGTGVREVKDAVGEVDPRRMLEAGDPEEPAKPKPEAAPKRETDV
jgi:sec-independent protein translocase protein TatA